jgi:methylated-DNA-[protein]-cysteine S-methyltransferase
MKKKRLRNIDYFYEIFNSPVGILYLIFYGNKLTEIRFDKPSNMPLKSSSKNTLQRELREYFDNGLDIFSQELHFTTGTEFDRKVWLTLKEVPFGETRTYKWLAERIGNPNASRAVGQSLSRNPIPIVLPCHRIIESDGSIGGFSAGIAIKRRLLDMEYYIKLSKKQG